MTHWKTNVTFRDLLKEYNPYSDNESEEIKRIKPLWVERFNTYASLKCFIPALKRVKTQAGFNKWLNGVYDYCDANRIWVNL